MRAARDAANHSQPPTDDRSGWKRLTGPYKSFFAPSAYAEVEAWYNTRSTSALRHELKALVKEIQSFDFAAAKAKLKATYDPDITTANAIVLHHGGSLLNDAALSKTVEWLSVAHPSKLEVFRRVFGTIRTPSNLCTLRHTEDMNPTKALVKVETSLVPKRTLIGGEHLQPQSTLHSYPLHAAAGDQTHYKQNFTWKFGSVPLAFCQRARDRREAHLAQQAEDEELVKAVHEHIASGVTTPFVLPASLSKVVAEESATNNAGGSVGEFNKMMYTPYGVLNTNNIDRRQWQSVTKETFAHTYYLEPTNTRLFQNLNDNFSRMLYLQRRKLRDERRRQACRLKEDTSASVLSQSGGEARAGSAATATADRSAVGSRPSTESWLREKSKRPVSVIFPSL